MRELLLINVRVLFWWFYLMLVSCWNWLIIQDHLVITGILWEENKKSKKFFFYIYNLHFFKQKVYSHLVLIYLNVSGIPVKKPLHNSQIVEEQLDVWILGVISASFLTGRHLLTRRLPTTSILVVIERIYCHQFKSNYLKN